MKLGIRHHFGHLYSKFISFVGRVLIAAVDNYHVIVSHSVIMDKAGAIHRHVIMIFIKNILMEENRLTCPRCEFLCCEGSRAFGCLMTH